MSGKKTWFGLVITCLAIIGEAAQQIGPDIDLNNSVHLVKLAGATVTLVGSLHKLIKAYQYDRKVVEFRK